ncbi:hypothetical protein Pcinc_014406 [Petrolisthes cinctipes]|uniref:BZIP domain-containing protein n=1 Tax=Petrolisthes cinctipes TaxID=88211 RepID=A0AAE1FXU0_PETCI|nr:hypothetical protein Pcinc_014406 [Petrolisthes cinctipes]
MEKKNNGKFGGARSKGPREVLSASPAPPSPQSFLTPSLDLSGQPYDVNGLQQALWNNQYLPPTDYTVSSNHHSLNPGLTTDHSLNPGLTTDHSLNSGLTTDHSLNPGLTTDHSLNSGLTSTGFSPDSGLSSTGLSPDSGLSSTSLSLNYHSASTGLSPDSGLSFNDPRHDFVSTLTDLDIDSVLSTNLDDFDLDSDLITSLLDVESLESEPWTPSDEGNQGGQFKETSVIHHQEYLEDVERLTSTVLHRANDYELGAVGGVAMGASTCALPPRTSDHELEAVGGFAIEHLTSAVLPERTNHLNFRVEENTFETSPVSLRGCGEDNRWPYPSLTITPDTTPAGFQDSGSTVTFPEALRTSRKGYRHRHKRTLNLEEPEKKQRTKDLNNEASRLRNQREKLKKQTLHQKLQTLEEKNVNLRKEFAFRQLLRQKLLKLFEMY